MGCHISRFCVHNVNLKSKEHIGLTVTLAKLHLPYQSSLKNCDLKILYLNLLSSLQKPSMPIYDSKINDL